jgi:hypothetical protein
VNLEKRPSPVRQIRAGKEDPERFPVRYAAKSTKYARQKKHRLVFALTNAKASGTRKNDVGKEIRVGKADFSI